MLGRRRGSAGDVEKALKSIKVPVLYMPSATDLYFPVTDARYEAQFIAKCRWCRFLRCGDIRRGRGRVRRMGSF